MSELPFMTLRQIQEAVDNMRELHPVLSEIPIDCEEFAELELGIEIIPVKMLRERVGADAFITRDFLSILIDDDYFNDPRMRTRNNFSIAHELGHLFLHRDYFDAQCPEGTEEEWIDFMQSMEDLEHVRLEWQANAFAALLLMPKVEMMRHFEKPGVSIPALGRAFGVSTWAISKRIEMEDFRMDFGDPI